MSGEGPESIPTSADPRSKRPTKKRALTPVSEQAATVDALFAKPDQEIRIPSGASSKRSRLAAPPEIVTNVQGSSAGAGSGEFHVYKASRRRENERLRAMDEALATEKAKESFEANKAERDARDDDKTRRNRQKRDKKKKARLLAASAAAVKAASGGDDGGNISLSRGLAGDRTNGGGGDQPMADHVSAPAPKAAGIAQPSGLVIHDDD